LPAGLYPRALIIVIAPMVVLQAIMATVILDHHWESVSRRLVTVDSRGNGFRHRDLRGLAENA
jgi:hypothetical protein